MTQPYLGEIRVVSFNYPPKGWAFCEGQFLTIAQNQALFSLLGTSYGGNGQTTFALPDLRGRAPMHVGQGHNQGQSAGEHFHTLIAQEMPLHNHLLFANGGVAVAGAAATTPQGNSLAQAFAVQPGGATAQVSRFSAAAPSTTMNAATIGLAGGSQPHENRQPFLTLNFCMALVGIFPSRN